MFILKNKSQLQTAISKARKIKPVVRMIAFGVYAVKGATGNYTVKMERIGNEKQVLCDCKGGERGLVCYHSTAALELHSTIAKHRQMATV